MRGDLILGLEDRNHVHFTTQGCTGSLKKLKYFSTKAFFTSAKSNLERLKQLRRVGPDFILDDDELLQGQVGAIHQHVAVDGRVGVGGLQHPEDGQTSNPDSDRSNPSACNKELI